MLSKTTSRGKEFAGSYDTFVAAPYLFRMETIIFDGPGSAVWLLFGIGLISFAVAWRRFSAGRYREPGRVIKLVLATLTFLFFFYSTTFAISLLYALDSALLSF
jgi:hypothetical protein